VAGGTMSQPDEVTESLARSVLDNALEGYQVIGPDFRYLYVNEAIALHGRTTRERLLGRTMMETYPGIEDTEMFSTLRRCMEDRSYQQMENEFAFPDGSKGWFELRFEPVPDGVAILSMDVSARKHAEQELRRSNRTLAVLSECNQTLVRATDERQFMEDICRILVERRGYRKACVGMKDGEGEHAVRPVACAGPDEGYADLAAGPIDRAIRTGQPVVAHFIAADPDVDPWSKAARERGFASGIVLPIRNNGETFGALTIYSAELDAFDDAERVLLEKMALDLGYGITTLRARNARREAEARVLHLNAVLRGIRNVNQLITRERDPQALIQRACELLVESRGFHTSCIVICDGDRVARRADAGVELKLRALRRMLADGELPDCVKRMIHDADIIVRQNPAETCAGCPVNEDYQSERDTVAVRLESEGKVYGALLVSLQPGLVSDEEVIGLLREVAGDVAFALRSIELQAEGERAQDALRASAERWRGTFDAITDIVCVITKDHEIADINQAGCTALGLSREQITGRKCFELVHGTSAPIAACPCTSVCQTLEPSAKVYEQDGRSYELLAWPLLGRERHLEGFAHIVKDVTERKRAEDELRLFREPVDRSNDALEVLDPISGRILDVNERGCLDLGYSREEYRALTVFDIDPMVDASKFATASDEMRQSGSMIWEGIHRRKDGSTFPVEVSIKLVQLDREYLVAVTRDITQRREAEAAIRRSRDTQEAIASILRLSLEDSPLEDLLQKVLHNVLSLPWLSVERKGAILLVEDKPGVLVMKAVEGLAGELRDRCARVPFGVCLCGRAASSGKLVHTGELDVRHENTYGGILPHGHYCVPISYAGQVLGVLNAYVAAGHTYMQQEADFLTSVADTLAGIIIRRKMEQERGRLEEQLKLVQRLEAVGRLAGGVAHDFNNLLSVIISYAGFAADALRESDPVHADIVEIQNAGQRAAALTRQLLAFSRKQLLEPEVLSINKVVTGIEIMLRRLLGEDIDIEVHRADELGSVLADPGQIEQVIMNLAVNARDAMPQGGKLTIETINAELDEGYAEQHVAVKPGRFVMLSVTDTGSGMDAETRAHIFEPFFTTKEKGKGTGLGLSTVYGIVKQSGGNIWVYSEPGRGTTFKVYLPRVDAPAADIKRRPVSMMATGSETVLIVEDEEAVRRLADRILRSAGYKVLTAAGGGEALLLCEKHDGAIDLLLTDVVMPQMSGRELAERLAKTSPKLKVLYMSGYTDNAIVHHGVLDPGTRFIGKPFAAAELTRKVREVLDEGKVVNG